MSTTARFAEAYVRRYGLKLVPLPPRAKRPVNDNWGQNLLDDPEQAERYFTDNPEANIGVALGPSRLCSLDVDDAEAFRLICEEYGINMPAVSAGAPTIQGASNGFRVMFAVPDGLSLPYHSLTWPKRDGRGRYTVLELRAACDGQQRQDVLPPSIHPDTGKPYVWLTRPNGSFPAPPDWLLTIWQQWDRFKPQLQDICPWGERTLRPPPASPSAVRDGPSVIDAYVQATPITEALERYGYSARGRRWISPHSQTGLPGVILVDDGRAWIHHASDPLCSDESGRPVNAFDLFCYYEHGGDPKKAAKAAAKALGLDAMRQPRQQAQAPTAGGVPPFVRSGDIAPAFSDAALAHAFVSHQDGSALYCSTWGRWLLWKGSRWVMDETLEAVSMVQDSCLREAAGVPLEVELTPSQQKRIMASLASQRTITNVEKLARSDRRAATSPAEWDSDHWELNTPGGVVDLRGGGLRPHRRADKMIKQTTVTPGGSCPTWLAFLDRVMGGDAELIGFLQRMCGYALTGVTREHALFFCYGTGGNGKGTFLNTITAIMGDYQRVANVETFTESRGDRHLTELARLHGARLVTSQETEEGRRWAESRIKALTGGDPITANFMRQDHFTFIPQFKLIIAGNHKPGFRAVDEAIKRRLHLIPFTQTIPAGERDETLSERLVAELPGILAWMVEGCLDWQRNGLRAPDSVKDATDCYLDDEDSMQAWIDECCDVGIGCSATNSDLFKSWSEWCEREGEHPGSSKRFGQRLESKRFQRSRTGRARGFEGIAVKWNPVGNGWVPS